MEGPIPRSNWLVPSKILIGAWPRDEKEADALISAGVTAFMALAGKPVYGYNYREKTNLLCHSFQFASSGKVSLSKVSRCADVVKKLIEQGHCVYMHCHGGHGRAGMVGAVVAGRWFGMQANAAIAYVENARAARRDKSRNFIPTPESTAQVQAVGELLGVESGKRLPPRSDRSWLTRVCAERSGCRLQPNSIL